VPHVGEQGSWGATRDEKIVVRRGGAWIILKIRQTNSAIVKVPDAALSC
jgi:hypothetical protein